MNKTLVCQPTVCSGPLTVLSIPPVRSKWTYSCKEWRLPQETMASLLDPVLRALEFLAQTAKVLGQHWPLPLGRAYCFWQGCWGVGCVFLGVGSLGAGNRTRIKGIVGADQRFPFIFLHPSPINTGGRLVHQSRRGSVSFVCGWISNA